MLSCVAPGCTYDATVVLMGMSVCPDHREYWFELQLTYHRSLTEEQLRSYQENLAAIQERYPKSQPVAPIP